VSKKREKRERQASFGDLPILVFDSQVIEKAEKDVIVGIGRQFFFFVGGRVYLVDV
jgi:hypothetical protein